MKYTVEAINGKQVTVLFENGQRAKPVIAADLTPEEIDIEIGRYDSSYRQVGTPTTAIKVGEERSTQDPKTPVKSNHKETAPVYDPYVVDLGQTANYMEPLTAYMLALKEAASGNTGLLDVLNARIAEIQADSDYSYDELLAALNNRG